MPSAADEDGRPLHRELVSLRCDRTRVANRIKGFLAGQGVQLEVTGEFLARLARVRLWDGTPLPAGLRARLEREWEKVRLLTEQIRAPEAERRRLLKAAPAAELVRRLLRLRGIGPNSAWPYVLEFFDWRACRNRREVGALAGLVPTPAQSGALHREQGICKAGNRYVRSLAIEIAWGWLRLQPQSTLSRWYRARFGQGGSRLRRTGIVALARKLLIEFWRYPETGAVPTGAALKA